MPLALTNIPCQNCPTRANCYNPNPTRGAVVGDRFALIKRCGKGAHGSVWQAKDLDCIHKQLVAVKIPNCVNAPNDTKVINELRDGVRLNRHRGQKHVLIPLEAFVRLDGRVCTVMDVMNGSLHDLKNTLRTKTVGAVLYQLLMGLDFLHQNCGVLHSDIKPDNILFSWDNHRITIKYSDFSCSHFLGDPRNTISSNNIIQARYIRAPETFDFTAKDGECQVSYGIDVWALGCVIFELWNMGECLFSNIWERNGKYDARKHFQQQVVLDLDRLVIQRPSASKELQDFVLKMLKGMLEFNSHKRATSSTYINEAKSFRY